MLEICPYRQSRRSKLECTITEKPEKGFTSSTSVTICNECSIPEIIQQVNCKNLDLVKYHSGIQTQAFDALPGEYVSDSGWRASCQVIDFNNSNDYKNKCSHDCPAFQPVNRDLSSEELILIPDFNAEKRTDRELRQAVLLILYKYHTRHPERYHCFDVTHEFIAKSLNISVPDVVRVIFPMEDEQEVVTERYLGEAYFRRVRITSRGIQMIDEELLFGRLNTAEVRVMGTLINMPNSQVSALSIGDNNLNKGEFMSEFNQPKYDQRNSNNQFLDTAQAGSNPTFNQHNLSQNINQSIDDITRLINSLREKAQEFPQDKREEALVHLDDLEEDISKPEKQKPERIKTRIIALITIAGTVFGVFANSADFTNNVLEIADKLGIPIPTEISQRATQQLPPPSH